MAKKFFYVCAGLLMLAFAYHLGVRNAQAQVAGEIIAAHEVSGDHIFVLLANGDAFQCMLTDRYLNSTRIYMGNVYGGGPTSSTQSSWGSVKVKAR